MQTRKVQNEQKRHHLQVKTLELLLEHCDGRKGASLESEDIVRGR
jgi:hypothetical protein